MFKELEKKGVELRIIKHRNWAIDIKDMDKAIDKNTRLVSLALVSNVNGFMHDVKAVSDIAHARGAYVFADIIQAVGAVPIDMRALGIDFASTGTYKWLMGERGFGFLYVREEHQGKVLPTTRYGHRQVSNFNRAQLTWEPLPGAAMYESGNIPVLLAAAVSAGIDYVSALGIDKIRAHARQLTDRLQSELPPLGYKSLTPRDTQTPIVAFELKDAARDRQDAAGREGGGDDHRQREPAAAVGVGVQHPRRHRSRRRCSAEASPRCSASVALRSRCYSARKSDDGGGGDLSRSLGEIGAEVRFEQPRQRDAGAEGVMHRGAARGQIRREALIDQILDSPAHRNERRDPDLSRCPPVRLGSLARRTGTRIRRGTRRRRRS